MKLAVLDPEGPLLAEAAALVVAVYEALRREHGLDCPSRKLDAAGLARRLADATGHVVLEDGRVVGFALTRPSRDVAGALYLGTVAVAAEARGRGVAALLVEAALGAARDGGYPSLALDTFDGAGGAGAYFARFGFVAHGRDGDVLTMVRAVEPGV